MAKIKAKLGASNKKKAAAPPASSATSKISAAAVPKAGGVAKRKHGHAKREHALLPQLAAEAPEPKRQESAKAKSRRKRAEKSTLLGAVDGMRSSLEELLAANERQQRDQVAGADQGPSAITSKKRQKLVAEETAHMQQVLEHPAFVADPFAALQEHIKNTVTAQAENSAAKKLKKAKKASS